MKMILEVFGEIVVGSAAFLAGAAILYLFSFGRAGPLSVDPELVSLAGLIVLFAFGGVAFWLGWLR
jgi:hypothetical protein